jgi:acetate kinase
MKVLVFNCGSSSVKYQLYLMPDEIVFAKGVVQRIGEDFSEAIQSTDGNELQLEEHVENHDQALEAIKKMLTHDDKGPLKSMKEIDACGHRVVHGGERFTGSVRIDVEIEDVIEEFIELAPLHNPANLAGIKAVDHMMGDVPQVACFDTAFHQTIPKVAYLYALPYEMYKDFKIRKYGFHGISHRYVARRAAKLMGRTKYDVNLITCHLGSGSSISAIKNGNSIDTSMGLTPLEGLVMGTRTGDVDAAIIFHLKRKGYSVQDQEKIFNKKSGLLGISGISNDVRDLENHATKGNKRAELALDIFAYKIKKYIGMYLGIMNGCDGIVLTGGIGENGINMRKRILENMESLGIHLDEDKNLIKENTEREIHAEDSSIKIFVIPTNEEKAIARDTYRIVKSGSFKLAVNA